MRSGPKLDRIMKKSDKISPSVNQLQFEIGFDLKLQEMAGYKEDYKDSLTKIQRSRLKLLKSCTVFFYFLVVPFHQSPNWCLEFYNNDPRKIPNFGVLDCDVVSTATGYRYSSIPTFSPLVTAFIDMVCLAAFCVFAYY